MSTNEYKRENYDKIQFFVRKGAGAKIRARAAELGMNLTEFVKTAIDNFDGWDNASAVPIINSERTQNAQNVPVSTNEQSIQPATGNATERITAADKRLLAAVDALPAESKKILLKFLESLSRE